ADAPVAARSLVIAAPPKNLSFEFSSREPMRRIPFGIGMLVVLAVGVASCDRTAKSGAGRASIDETRLQIGIAPGPLSGDEDLGRRAPMFKAGHWTPILVKIAGRDDLENTELVVQTVDSDDV